MYNLGEDAISVPSSPKSASASIASPENSDDSVSFESSTNSPAFSESELPDESANKDRQDCSEQQDDDVVVVEKKAILRRKDELLRKRGKAHHDNKPKVLFVSHLVGQKRKNKMVDIEEMLERSDEKAAEREMKMRKMELELESKMRDREDERDEKMLNMFATLMQQFAARQNPYPPPHYMAPAPSHSSYHSQSNYCDQ